MWNLRLHQIENVLKWKDRQPKLNINNYHFSYSAKNFEVPIKSFTGCYMWINIQMLKLFKWALCSREFSSELFTSIIQLIFKEHNKSMLSSVMFLRIRWATKHWLIRSLYVLAHMKCEARTVRLVKSDNKTLEITLSTKNYKISWIFKHMFCQ